MSPSFRGFSLLTHNLELGGGIESELNCYRVSVTEVLGYYKIAKAKQHIAEPHCSQVVLAAPLFTVLFCFALLWNVFACKTEKKGFCCTFVLRKALFWTLFCKANAKGC